MIINASYQLIDAHPAWKIPSWIMTALTVIVAICKPLWPSIFTDPVDKETKDKVEPPGVINTLTDAAGGVGDDDDDAKATTPEDRPSRYETPMQDMVKSLKEDEPEHTKKVWQSKTAEPAEPAAPAEPAKTAESSENEDEEIPETAMVVPGKQSRIVYPPAGSGEILPGLLEEETKDVENS